MPILVDPPPLAPGEDSGTPTIAILGESGIVLKDTDAYGVKWDWYGGEPWAPGPSPREQSGDRAYGHGQWDATRWYGPRTIQINGRAWAPNHDALHLAKQRFMDAIGIDLWKYQVIEPGPFDRYAMVRRQGDVLWSEDGVRNSATWSASLYAPDPRIYGSDVTTFSTDFPSSAGGLTWPATWPATWDASVVSGVVQLTNNGTQSTFPRIRVTGPLPDLTIFHPDTGKSLTISNPLGPTLAAGEWLDIDMARRQILLLDTGYRRSWARGDWLSLPPGASELRVGSSEAGVGASVSGEVLSVWI